MRSRTHACRAWGVMRMDEISTAVCSVSDLFVHLVIHYIQKCIIHIYIYIYTHIYIDLYIWICADHSNLTHSAAQRQGCSRFGCA